MGKDKRPHARNLCGAKTRAGTPCKNGAMANGRCRMHGGKSKGVKNNKNAVTTGERESIVFDFLEDDEKELLNQIELDQLKQINNEIKLIDIRLRRMMQRISVLAEEDMTSVQATMKTDEFGKQYEEVKESSLSQIQNIEEAITRVQAQKLRLIKTKHELEMDLGINLETKEAQLDQIKAKTENLKGLSNNIEDTSDLRRLLLNEGD